MFGTDEDDDLIPSGSSKLASLFGQPMEEGNTSLTYTAPKQPKKNRPEPTPAVSTSPGKLDIVAAKAVQTYKLEGGSYVTQGKLGVALLGNLAIKLYQLLLYKSKVQHVTVCKITDKFQFTVQARNYATFYDEKGQNWSIMFEDEKDVIDFAREVGLAKASVPSENEELPFYVQDLKVGVGTTAEMGDLLEIRYTTLPLVDGKLEDAIETNVNAEKPQRVSIRKGVWEEALIGATKGCKKLIVLAPVYFGPWKPLAGANNRLAVEVEVGRIKTKKGAREGSPFDVFHRPESSESNVDSSTDETSIKARGASISEALTNSPKTHKASIISRMARMGQATLPLRGSVKSHPSDSEETEEECTGSVPNAAVPGKSILKNRTSMAKRSSTSPHVTPPSAVPQEKGATASKVTNSSSAPIQQLSLYQTAPLGWHAQNQPPQYLINGVPVNFTSHPEGQVFSPHHQVVPVPAMLPAPSGTPLSESQMSVYFSENRTHNAEVRMGLTKVADKVDKVLGKLDTMQQPAVGVIDPRTLLASIQKLVLENEQMQGELNEKRIKMEQQNEKIYQLLNQKFLEQNSTTNSTDQQSDTSLQVVVLGLEQEKAKLSSELNDALAKMNSLQIQTSNFERISIELREEVKNLTGRLQTACVELDCSKQALIDQTSLTRSLKEKTDASVNLHDTQDSIINDLEIKVKDLLTKKNVLETALTESKTLLELERNKNREIMELLEKARKGQLVDVQKEIHDMKMVMNTLFKVLKSEFVPGITYDESRIKAIILSSIQNVTLQYIDIVANRTKSDQKDPKKEEKISVPQKEFTESKKCEINSEKIPESTKELSTSDKSDVTESKKKNELSQDKPNKVTDTENNNAKDKVDPCDVPNEHVSQSECSVAVKKPGAESRADAESKLEKENGKDQSLGTNQKLQVTKPRESSVERGWRPQPPPTPLFDDEEEDDDDDWLS